MLEDEIDTTPKKKLNEIIKTSLSNTHFNTEKMEKNFNLNLSPIPPKKKSFSITSDINDILEATNNSPPIKEFTNLIPIGIKCKIKDHNIKYISLDRNKMAFICKKCLEYGLAENNLEIFDENEKINLEKNNDNLCNGKCGNIAYYYCITCNQFLCYHCLMINHNNHSIETINYESNSFKDDINIEIGLLNRLIEAMGNCKINVKKIEKEDNSKDLELINKIKTTIDQTTNIIKKSLDEKMKELNKTFIEIYEGFDNDNESIFEGVKQLKLNIKNALLDIEELNKYLNDNSLNSINKVEILQEGHKKYKEIEKLVKQSNNILNAITMNDFNTKENNNKKKLQKENINSNLKTLENSVKYSIQSGSNSECYHLNRFKSFQHHDLKFFKSTSLCFSTKKNITLFGLNICSLYFHKKQIKNPNFIMQKIDERGFLNIEIVIKNNNEIKFKENKKLYGAINVNDPIISIFFSSPVNIEKDNNYIITINNLSKDNFYADFWTGSCPSITHDNLNQLIHCNCTGIYFAFTSPDGIQSDFNEFSIGIIEGIIYSTTK